MPRRVTACQPSFLSYLFQLLWPDCFIFSSRLPLPIDWLLQDSDPAVSLSQLLESQSLAQSPKSSSDLHKAITLN